MLCFQTAFVKRKEGSCILIGQNINYIFPIAKTLTYCQLMQLTVSYVPFCSVVLYQPEPHWISFIYNKISTRSSSQNKSFHHPNDSW